jgi:uncharacterized protein (TIGR00255 family)
MIQSMTGFGAAEGRVGKVRVTVELRTVNHRFFNPSIKVPASFARWEGDVREALRQRIARGHVSVSVRIVREGEGTGGIDEARFAAYVEQLRSLQQRHGLAGDVDVGTVLRMPEVFVTRATDGDEEGGSAADLVAVVNEAAYALTAMRSDEGRRLAAYLRERVGVIEDALARIAERAPGRLVEQRDRLREAVRELTEGLAVDEQRLAQEIAILADRLDVSEELDRFGSHIAAFREALRDGASEPVGKRLGFLLQEMLREANTTGSKANDAAMLRDVVALKEELERIREQVENLE